VRPLCPRGFTEPRVSHLTPSATKPSGGGPARGTYADKLLKLELVVAALVRRADQRRDHVRRGLHLHGLEHDAQLVGRDVAVAVQVQLLEVLLQLLEALQRLPVLPGGPSG